jgi:hypothetical protein
MLVQLCGALGSRILLAADGQVRPPPTRATARPRVCVADARA